MTGELPVCENLLLRRERSRLYVTLNRPETRNALTGESPSRRCWRARSNPFSAFHETSFGGTIQRMKRTRQDVL